MRRYLDGRGMDDVAIERIRSFEAEALEMHPDGYIVGHSGGKDSTAVWDLAKRAKVKHEALHSLTTADPVELVWFVKTLKGVRIVKPPMTMWKLIRKKKMLPTMFRAWCCEKLKERAGQGRFVITGIRAAESRKRQRRRMVEDCYRSKGKRYLNPIIDWPTDAVWEYIRERGLPYCSLYNEGFKRLGCVLCPKKHDIRRELIRWPRHAAAWHRASDAAWAQQPENDVFPTAGAYWQWWKSREPLPQKNNDPVLFEDDPDATP